MLVLDQERRFLEYTHPAMARKLLKDGQATVYSKSPFAIQLNKSVATPNRSKTEDQMAINNYTEFFKEERDIYVQNISNCQVSLNFEVSPGRSEPHLFSNAKDPVNLTRFIPFQAIKQSMELRRMLNRVPPALQLLTEAEYEAYYDRAAKSQGLKSSAEALEKAEQKRLAILNREKLPDAPDPVKIHEVVEDGKRMGEKKTVRSLAPTVSESEEINARVLNLCLQVHPQVPDTEKMSAQAMLVEIDGISGMTLLDWEYVQSHGYYKSVKNLARKQVAEMASAAVADDEAEEAAAAPAPKVKAAKKASQTTIPSK